MIGGIKALFVFCEGQHDIACVSQILTHCFGFARTKTKAFSDYPYPFANFARSALLRHVTASPESTGTPEIGVETAHSFFLPDRVLENGGRQVYIFNGGGHAQLKKVRDEFLAYFLPLLEGAGSFGRADLFFDEIEYLFLFDADTNGTRRICDMVAKAFAQIELKVKSKVLGKIDWMSNDWEMDAINPFAARNGQKAIYVWGGLFEAAGEFRQQGSLEDLLHPMFEKDNSAAIVDAQATIDGMFDWNTNGENLKSVVAENAKRKKAIFTLLGQREKPGMSMSVILDQAGLIKPETWKTEGTINAFVQFLSRFSALHT